MDLCKTLDVRVVNGRCGADYLIGRQTCKNSSVTDYVIMSPVLFPSIQYFRVLDFDPLLSDIHCPVAFTISVQSQIKHISANEEIFNLDASRERSNNYTWKSESKLEFLNHIQEANLDQICTDQSGSLSTDSINNITSKISQVLTNAAENSNMVQKKIHYSANSNKNIKHQKPWFNSESKLERKEYITAKRKYRQLNSTENYEKLVIQVEHIRT